MTDVIVKTIIPSLVGFGVVVIIAALLNSHSRGEKLYNFLLHHKRSIVVCLVILIILMPILFILGRNRSVQEIVILFGRRLFLSFIFILSFIITLVLLRNFDTISRLLKSPLFQRPKEQTSQTTSQPGGKMYDLTEKHQNTVIRAAKRIGSDRGIYSFVEHHQTPTRFEQTKGENPCPSLEDQQYPILLEKARGESSIPPKTSATKPSAKTPSDHTSPQHKASDKNQQK